MGTCGFGRGPLTVSGKFGQNNGKEKDIQNLSKEDSIENEVTETKESKSKINGLQYLKKYPDIPTKDFIDIYEISKDVNCNNSNAIYSSKKITSPFFDNIKIQSKESLCQIINKNKEKGIGFFCLIPFPTIFDILPVLITNNKILTSDEISIDQSINIILNSKEKYELKIDENSKIYNKNGIIMIEVKNDDKLNHEHFLRFINFNNVNEYKNSYSSQNCYYFNYSEKENINYCLGYMHNIDNFKFILFTSNEGSADETSGSPILSSSQEVIGIYMENKEGNYLNDYIREFYEMESVKNEPNDEITIIYQKAKDSDTKLNIFGKTFVDKNKDKCKILVNDIEQELVENIDIPNNNEFYIKLRGINSITDASYMFKDCVGLIALPDFGKWDITNINNMEGLFWNCWNLTHISNNIFQWNTINLRNIHGMFFGCVNMIYLPNISKWNTNNLESMTELFHYCESLRKVPDISKYNLEKITSLNLIFADCKFLKSLPDISNWNTNNITEFIGLFEDCESIESLPDISKWNTNNLKTLDRVFNCCKALKSLPDISKWNIDNVTSMQFLFQGCANLNSLPDISKWNTEKVTSMQGMFNSCVSLTELPDISKWNTSNVINMDRLFNMCDKLKSFPNISSWDTKNLIKNEPIFNCGYASVCT